METVPRVFKPRFMTRLLGWGLIVGFGGGIAALLVKVALNFRELPAEELWSALWLGLFLLIPMLLGAGVLRSYFVLGADYIDIVRPYGTRRFMVSELAGFGTLVIVVNLVPLFHVRLYRAGPVEAKPADAKPVEIGKIPVSFSDRAEVERWFAQRLPRVDDPGSVLRPKPRFRGAAND